MLHFGSSLESCSLVRPERSADLGAQLSAKAGGAFSKTMKNRLKRWEDIFPTVDPRLIMGSNEDNSPNPVRLCPDATGKRGLASLSCLSKPERPFRIPRCAIWLPPLTRYTFPSSFLRYPRSSNSEMSRGGEKCFCLCAARQPAQLGPMAQLRTE